VGVKNFERDRRRRRVRKIVVDYGAVGRIGGEGFVGWERSVGVVIALNAVGGSGREEMDFGCGQMGDLAERGDVVEDPEAAAVRGYDQIVVVNPEVTHGGVWKIQVQGLPVIAVVK
jgi:hypothetical protein